MTALGMSEAGLSLMGDRYLRAIAQPTSRKLALLVGINQYPNAALTGCVTDVELQRELLIHRFGFQPGDVLVLADEKATRENIESAFISHLTEQATDGDIVVFHFSGYGRRTNSSAIALDVQNSFVPVDGIDSSSEQPFVNDLLEETLQLLLRSLRTDKVTTILDTSYINTDSPLIGSLRIRSQPSVLIGQPSNEELAVQEQLLSDIKANKEQVRAQRRFGQLPGVVLAAANPTPLKGNPPSPLGEKAFEAQWNGFSAGLFTYALTQRLWVSTPTKTLRVSLSEVSEVVEQLAGNQEQPKLSGQNSQKKLLPVYYLTPNSEVAADGVVIKVEEDGKTTRLWLAGIPASAIEYYGVNSLLTLMQPDGTASPLQLQIRDRDGLTAKAKLKPDASTPASPAVQVGQLVREAIRVLPRNLSLTVGIGTDLQRIERVDATSAFSSIPDISTAATGESPQPVDCLFGKGDGTAGTQARYGLFSPGNLLIPNTLGEEGEAVKTAVRRFIPQLEALRAAKLLRLTVNAGSSRLGVRAALEMVAPQQRILQQREPVRDGEDPQAIARWVEVAGVSGEEMLALPVGSRIRYRLENRETRPIYFLLFGLDNIGSIISVSRPSRVAISPIRSSPTEKEVTAADERSRVAIEGAEQTSIFKQAVIPPGETAIVPGAIASVEWAVSGPTGLAETQLIFSISPFSETLDVLEVAKFPSEQNKLSGILSNPLEVAQAVLADLHRASETSIQSPGGSTDSLALDVNAWATLSFIYRVV